MISFWAAIRYCMNDGMRISRIGWNGPDMWVCYIPPSVANAAKLTSEGAPDCLVKLADELNGLTFSGKFALKAADNSIQVGWAPSQADMSASDWIVLDE